jgi:NAD+ synthase
MPVPTLERLTIPELDVEKEIERVAQVMRTQVGDVLKRRGAIVGMSGGVDSSVCAGLAVRAFGHRRVLGVFMPERDSDPASLGLAAEWAGKLGIEHIVEDIAPILDAAGCYRRRDDAIRAIVPAFRQDWRFKIVLPGARFASGRLNLFSLVLQPPHGPEQRMRLTPEAYRTIVAATNFKQRTRKMLEYFHADRLHYAVVGTPNRLEYDQGFFVKGGDGLADVKPIAHLYKTQVYALAEALGVPKDVTDRPPTTDTYSLPQSQEEFYFSLPAAEMDRVLYAHTLGLSPSVAARPLGLDAVQVARAFRDLEQKRSTTRYLHLPPLLAETDSDPARTGANGDSGAR